MTRRHSHSGVLLVVAAPSGAGKTSLVNALLDRHRDLHVSVSHTTRPQRAGEVDGVDYYFVDQDEFQQMIAVEAFLEHACVFGNNYGTAAEPVAAQLAGQRDVVLEIDWQGASQIRTTFPDAVTVFILPPSRSALLERLRGRGQDDEQTIERRTAQAVDDMRHHDEFDHVVVNDDFDAAVTALDAILVGHRSGVAVPPQNHSELIARLLSCAGSIE